MFFPGMGALTPHGEPRVRKTQSFPTTILLSANNHHQNKNQKFDASKAKITREVQLFSLHSYESVISVYVFA
jgi:hypothetical protein